MNATVRDLGSAPLAPAGEGTADPADAAVHSYDEFTRLREVIVGSAASARLPLVKDRSAWLNLFPELPESEWANVEVGTFPERVVAETEEDLLALVELLEGEDVTVRRVGPSDPATEFGAPGWRSDGFSAYCPRDSALIVGQAIIETPSPMRARYFESFALRHLFQDYMRRGAAWIAAPKPRLSDDLYGRDDQGRPTLGEAEPVFEAANVLRCGADVLYQVSSSGNVLGGRWLQQTLAALGPFRVHPVRGVYDFTHLDSTLALLRPGLVLANPERVTLDNLPELLRSWDVIWCPPMAVGPATARHSLSSPWIGMNLLMVGPDLAVVDAAQHELITRLERHGIAVAPLRLRHARALGGGFHCVTLDVHRDGGLVSYAG